MPLVSGELKEAVALGESVLFALSEVRRKNKKNPTNQTEQSAGAAWWALYTLFQFVGCIRAPKRISEIYWVLI